GAQFSIGSTVFECVGGGKEQPSDDSARTVLVPPEEVGATILAPADEQPEVRFWLEILESGDAALAGQEIAVHSTEAILGRDEDCTVVLDDQAISRRHARIERTTEGFRVTDLGSTNGVWLGDQRIDEPVVLEPGRPVLIGTATRLAFYTEPREQRQAEPQPQPALEIPEVDAAKEIPEVDAAKTLFIQSTAEEIARTRPLEAEGESIEVRANEPFLIDDPGTAWYVVEGGIDVFTVSIEGGKPAGTRSHFLGVLPGQCLFGFDLQGQGSGFLAVGKPGTRLRKVTVSRLRELAGGPGSESVAQLVETWVAGLSRSLARDVPTPGEWDLLLRPGEGASIGPAQRASAGAGVAWVDIWSGSALFIDMAIPVFSGRRTLFPVTPDSWIQPVGDEFGELSLEPRSTDQAVADRELWQGLQVFHQVLCECEFINKKLAAVDEFIRLQDKAQYAEAAKEAAYDAIGSVLRSEAATPREFLQTGSPEPIYQACRMVGEALVMEVKKHPGADQSLTYEERVNAIASTSGFRTRVVALRGEWWKGDHGPLLAQRQKTQDPVALLPTGPTSYECLDPRTGETREVDDEVADSLSGFAYSFYRPFPEGKISVRDLIRFGARGLKHDLLTLIGLAALIGILGTATPYFIGQVFDRAVPDSNTRLLFGFGLALIGAGVAAFAFRFTQAVATLRVQGKMESSIQAALWDRLMNLPANFFRDYSAGDLADRASGIDAIQSLVSGAGVLAILGSISGLFYVALMLAYSFLLAGVAVVLTGFYVGVTWLCNYLQLRHQRVELG
ncbi:MAG: FHA domain-containing protein, partial [Acidimicrobiia bacterium]